MARDERNQNRWVVDLGGGDTFVVERTPAGLVVMSMPKRRQASVNSVKFEQVERALRAAKGEGGSDGVG